jgi:sulfate transport system substrate-binding protein
MPTRRRTTWLALAILAVSAAGCGPSQRGPGVELINVSYDPTRELYQEINATFAVEFERQTGTRVEVVQSHGGSGAQARAVSDGLQDDVVTLALAGDVDALRQRGLIAAGWQERLPNNSCPYTSSIVFVVRAGNPKGIRDWPDLVRPGVQVVTPNPKTSGGARWNFLAAWGYMTLQQKQGEAEARDFLRRLYANVVKLDPGARGATESFVRRNQGDVLLAWENEALLLRREGSELVYPSATIRAEPPVAVVDRHVDERGTRAAAEAYLRFLYTDAAQDLIGKHGYRPSNERFLKKYAATLPRLKLFTLEEVAGDWAQARQRFFADGAIFDQIYARERRQP